MGPQVSEEQLNRIKGYCRYRARGRRDCRCRRRSRRSSKAHFKTVTSFSPTIFSEVKNNMRVAQEEIFGPVVSVISFKDEDDLIKQANDTIYGLSAGIWTNDITRAHRFAKEIKAGVDLDQYLQHVQCCVSLWWLQAVRLRPRNGPARA